MLLLVNQTNTINMVELVLKYFPKVFVFSNLFHQSRYKRKLPGLLSQRFRYLHISFATPKVCWNIVELKVFFKIFFCFLKTLLSIETLHTGDYWFSEIFVLHKIFPAFMLFFWSAKGTWKYVIVEYKSKSVSQNFPSISQISFINRFTIKIFFGRICIVLEANYEKTNRQIIKLFQFIIFGRNNVMDEWCYLIFRFRSCRSRCKYRACP